jgi:hypothetical protein
MPKPACGLSGQLRLFSGKEISEGSGKLQPVTAWKLRRPFEGR